MVSASGPIILRCCMLILCSRGLAMNNGLARTPVMGYNTWNCFGGDINQNLVEETADLLKQTGLQSAGYRYLVLDDAWGEPERSQTGQLEGNKHRFPGGISKLAQSVHAKGFKFGIYSDAGARTCLGFPGSRGHEERDAQTFADFGVDFLKYDNCYAPPSDWIVDRYTAMSIALNKTDRPIVFSMCNWGVGDSWASWGPEISNSWRTTGDIAPTWESILRCLDNTVGLSRFAGPGAWNDPDLLEVGNGVLTLQEQRSHFALWALLKAPLMVSADLRQIQQQSLDVLRAAEVIAVNQDAMGVAGDLIWKQGPYEVYAGPLEDGGRAVVLFNRHIFSTQYPLSNITVTWEQLGYAADVKATVREMYARQDLGVHSGAYTATVDVHDVAALRITPSTKEQGHHEWRPWHAARAGRGPQHIRQL